MPSGVVPCGAYTLSSPPFRAGVVADLSRIHIALKAHSGRLAFEGQGAYDAQGAHQPPDAPVPHVDSNFLRLFGHARAAVAAQAQARLLSAKL